jgi:hypothetical protein
MEGRKEGKKEIMTVFEESKGKRTCASKQLTMMVSRPEGVTLDYMVEGNNTIYYLLYIYEVAPL